MLESEMIGKEGAAPEADTGATHREIRSRRRRFFAFLLALVIGCMPTVRVMADTISIDHYNPETVTNKVGTTVNSGDTIQRTSGGLLVIYETPKGNDQYTHNYWSSADYIIESIKGYSKYTIVKSIWNSSVAVDSGVGRYELTLSAGKPAEEKQDNDDRDDDDRDDDDRDNDDRDDDDRDNDDRDDDEDHSTPSWVLNPDEWTVFYYVNGSLEPRAKFGKQTQGDACRLAFKTALPAGWQEAFTFSMTMNDRHTTDLKDGTLMLCVPEGLQKTGREYAVMGIDKNGRVTVFTDTDKQPFMLTSRLYLEGYAFELIYKDQ